MENTSPDPAFCANCNQELPAADVIFCPHCGQKNNNGKVRMREFLSRFFQHFTHLDNKFVRTVHDLFVPGKMTEIYFRGKRKRYPHPVQLFFIVMFFFLITANHYSNQAIRIGPSNEKSRDQKSTTDAFFRSIQRHSSSLRLHQLVDSLPAGLRDAHVREAVDSLLLLSHDSMLRYYQQSMLQSDTIYQLEADSTLHQGELWRRWPDLDSLNLQFGHKTYMMDISDVAWLSEEELVDKYRIENFRDRLLMKQGIKVIHDPGGLAKSYFGSFSWTILILVGLMSAFLLLLYRRQRRYYVEHFVFLLHWHSAVLLLFTVVLLLGRVLSDIRAFAGIAALWAIISLFWALHRYYRSSIRGTTWRWLAFMLVYMMAFALVFAIGLFVVLLIF